MSALSAWIEGVLNSMKRECILWSGNAKEVFFCVIMPVVWILVIWGLLGDGIMTRLPIATVDEDKSTMSREILRALDSARSLGIRSYENSISALAAMRAGTVYGVVVIPYGYMRDKLSGTGSAVILYADENRFGVAGTVAQSVSEVMTGFSDEELMTSLLKTGAGESGASRILELVHSDFYKLGNMGASFLIFLSSTLIPGLITIGATFAFMSAILREIWNKSVLDWYISANSNFSAALLGKLTPHFVFYCLVFLFYIALFCGRGGFAPAGSLIVWFFCGAATIAVFAPMCILITAFSPTWRLALIIGVGYAAPSLPFSGFSIPLDSMEPGVRFFTNFIPISWYLKGESQQWVLGAGLNEMGNTFLALGLLFIVPLIIGLPFFNRKFSRIAEEEQKEQA